MNGQSKRYREAMRAADYSRLLVLRGHDLIHGRPPTLREIMPLFGIKSTSAARALLIRLEKRGHIKRGPYYSVYTTDLWYGP